MKRLCIFLLGLVVTSSVYAQATKPNIVLIAVPSSRA
jgi:hypothetical protein